MAPRKTLILVVDDDIRIQRMMRRMLELDGYAVIAAGDGQAALDILDRETPDLVLLDIMLPGMDGYEVCRRIREFSRIPIIMVTAKGNDQEKVDGLDAGADDYVTKPFATGELTARVRAVLRRAAQWEEAPMSTFTCGDLVIDFARRRVSLCGRDVNLTGTEYRLLSYLAQNADRVVTPNQILKKVWGEEYSSEMNLLQANIARLRRKLGDDAREPRYIFTRPGIGYMLARASEP